MNQKNKMPDRTTTLKALSRAYPTAKQVGIAMNKFGIAMNELGKKIQIKEKNVRKNIRKR